MQIKIKYFDKQMKNKGFINRKNKRKNNPHMFFYLTLPDGSVCTQINTWRSVHSSQKYISDSLIKIMSDQLHFENKKDFEQYIECNYSYTKYIKKLQDLNLI